jgi:XTP/dITP diphosphohydrolase
MSYIVIASANSHKVEEYRELLKDQDVELQSLADYPGFPGVEENGSTFTENASIKAVAVSKYCEAAAFADDSGLEVAALDNRPGIYSARYAENDPARRAKLLKELEGVTDRRARFVCVIAIAFNGEIIETFEGEVTGTILTEERGEGGFGYDPLFVPDGYDQTFAEMPQELKNKISHRAKAFGKAVEFIEEQLSVLGDVF